MASHIQGFETTPVKLKKTNYMKLQMGTLNYVTMTESCISSVVYPVNYFSAVACWYSFEIVSI